MVCYRSNILRNSYNFLSLPLNKFNNVKNLWSYVAVAFNRVDADRLKLIGPDRLCAEWILKNGGGVCFTTLPGKYLYDYNSLPGENVRLQLKEIDASNSSIMKIGFDHFKNCKFIDKIILHNCKHLESDSLDGLIHLKNTLKFLQISGCYNLIDESLLIIKELKNLQKLILFDLQYVKNLQNVIDELSKFLPNCEIKNKI